MEQNDTGRHNAVLFNDVTVRRGSLTILDKVNARVPAAGCTAIIGPNGAGKTSLIMTLLGEVPCTGRVQIQCGTSGAPLRVGYVPQRLNIDRGMPLTVMEFLAMGTQRKPLWLGVQRRQREEAMHLLGRVHAENLSDRKVGDLSGGELQRVLLALALRQDPELLVLDEASAGVDFRGEQLFCDLLEDLREQQKFTQLMVSHDLGMVAHHATHVICLNRHVVAEGTPDEVLNGETLMTLFGIHMGLIARHKEKGAEQSCLHPADPEHDCRHEHPTERERGHHA